MQVFTVIRVIPFTFDKIKSIRLALHRVACLSHILPSMLLYNHQSKRDIMSLSRDKVMSGIDVEEKYQHCRPKVRCPSMQQLKGSSVDTLLATYNSFPALHVIEC